MNDKYLQSKYASIFLKMQECSKLYMNILTTEGNSQKQHNVACARKASNYYKVWLQHREGRRGVVRTRSLPARLSSLLGQPPPRVCGGWSARLHTITPLITGISFSPDVLFKIQLRLRLRFAFWWWNVLIISTPPPCAAWSDGENRNVVTRPTCLRLLPL